MVTLEEIQKLEGQISNLERQAEMNDEYARHSAGNTWSGITRSLSSTADAQYAEVAEMRKELTKLKREYNAQYTTCPTCGGHGKVLKED